MIQKLLIANRGEIACRIAATATLMGLDTVAVFSEADRQSMHVTACDEAVCIGPAETRDSYLAMDRLLAAAKTTGADAIHPGYGFLSENAEFAEACAAAGIVFVGPPANVIRIMGSKAEAKSHMVAAGVPLIPGYYGAQQDVATLQQQADVIGYPLIIKASAGGGGKGMRVVHHSADFSHALAACQRESLAFFGDDQVLLEKYLPRSRHVEIQVFSDTQGHHLHLFERDCSLQRRHQKIIEEAPAPGLSDDCREAMGKAAVAAAASIGYVGAGTVEFLLEPGGQFYFMEMNTRLQVEHPVTEMVTGMDLVEWQLRVAAGEPLPAEQNQLRCQGHAFEARIYAENTRSGFLPSTGRLSLYELPAGVRIDSGVSTGSEITPYYDPMIAKLIVHGNTRQQALLKLQQALSQSYIAGVDTNLGFLQRLISQPEVIDATMDTGFVDRSMDQLLEHCQPTTDVLLASALYWLQQPDDHHGDVWDDHSGWQLNLPAQRRLDLAIADHHHVLMCRSLGVGYRIRLDGADHNLSGQRTDTGVLLENDGTRRPLRIHQRGERLDLFTEDGLVTVTRLDQRAVKPRHGRHSGSLLSPMPGKVIALEVAAGDPVREGQTLMIIEAMKMEHAIRAPADGVVALIDYAVGDLVSEGTELLQLVADPDAQAAS